MMKTLKYGAQQAFHRKGIHGILDRVVRHQAGQKIFLIIDRHAVHKTSKVVKWLGENEDKIRLFFLPTYS